MEKFNVIIINNFFNLPNDEKHKIKNKCKHKHKKHKRNKKHIEFVEPSPEDKKYCFKITNEDGKEQWFDRRWFARDYRDWKELRSL